MLTLSKYGDVIMHFVVFKTFPALLSCRLLLCMCVGGGGEPEWTLSV